MAVQNPFVSTVSRIMNGVFSVLNLGKDGALLTSAGGFSSSLNLVAGATQVIKNTPGRVCRLVVNTAGTASAWSIWDGKVSGDAVAGNLVWTAAFGASGVAVSSIVLIDFPCQNGIIITVPTSGVASLSWI